MHHLTKHVRIKFKGRTDKIQRFHRVMYALDKDWPYAAISKFPNEKLRRCEKCRGLTYRMPKFTEDELKAFGKKMNIGIKIKTFKPESACWIVPGGGKFFMPNRNMVTQEHVL